MKTGSALNISCVHKQLVEPMFPLNLDLKSDYKTNGLTGLPELSLPPILSASLPFLPRPNFTVSHRCFLHLPFLPLLLLLLYSSLSLVPQFTLARPRFDPLILPHKQVQTHTHTRRMCMHKQVHTHTHRHNLRQLHKTQIASGCEVM